MMPGQKLGFNNYYNLSEKIKKLADLEEEMKKRAAAIEESF